MPVEDLSSVENGGVAVLPGKKVGTALAVVPTAPPEQSLHSSADTEPLELEGQLAGKVNLDKFRKNVMEQRFC